MQAVAGERACMHSITAYGSQLLILGETGLYLIALRTWNEVNFSSYFKKEITR